MTELFTSHSKLILASGSPRRKDLLSSCGFTFDVIVSDCDETEIPGEPAKEMVERLAQSKAAAIASIHPNAWVIGADTTVVLDGKIFGKPTSKEDAERMLSSLQGRPHTVWGGICILNLEKKISFVESHASDVEMISLSKADIKAYVETGEPMDKAGAYAVQGIGASLISRIEGSYTNVVGLNLSATVLALRKLGFFGG